MRFTSTATPPSSSHFGPSFQVSSGTRATARLCSVTVSRFPKVRCAPVFGLPSRIIAGLFRVVANRNCDVD